MVLRILNWNDPETIMGTAIRSGGHNASHSFPCTQLRDVIFVTHSILEIR